MKFFNLSGAFALALGVLFSLNTAVAGERGVFKGKTRAQHELTQWESKKMAAEFKSRFKSTDEGAFQKLNKNPWEAKRSRQQQHNKRMLKLSNNWSGCREYAYKQRGRCYAKGGDAYTCERYYDARVDQCDKMF